VVSFCEKIENHIYLLDGLDLNKTSMENEISKESIITVAKAFVKSKGYSINLNNLNINEKELSYFVEKNYVDIKEEYTEVLKPGMPPKIIQNVKCTFVGLKSKLYEDFHEVFDNAGFDWSEKLLLECSFPLKSVFFDPRLIQLIRYDPKYLVNWIGYRMGVYPSDDDGGSIKLYIKNLCMGYDTEKDEPVLSIFIDEILSLDPIERGLLRPYYIAVDSNCKIANQNITNLIDGELIPSDDLDIYQVILEGIKIFNYIIDKKYNFEFFNVDYDDRGISFFSPLFYPTKGNWATFIISTAVIFIDKINVKQLNKYIWENRDHIKNTETAKEFLKRNKEIFNKKTDFDNIRSRSLLELFICNNPNCKFINESLKDIWNERSNFSHTYYEDEYNIIYHEEQDIILIKLYLILKSMIDFEDPKKIILYENKNYNFFKSHYGMNGEISNNCGFNRPGCFHKYATEHKDFIFLK